MNTFFKLTSGSSLTHRSLIGCGGLGTGMDLSRAVETKWAVEYWEPAAKTYEYVLSVILNIQR